MSDICSYCGKDHTYLECPYIHTCAPEVVDHHGAEITRLRAELAEARIGANRYQHVRQAPKGWWEKLGDCLGESFDTAVDAAIDAALSTKGKS